MSLIHWTPLWDAFEDMEKMLQGTRSSFSAGGFMLPIDRYQIGDAIIVETALPHIDPEKLNVKVVDNQLVIEGESEQKNEVDEKDYYRKEIRRGNFYRVVPLPGRSNGNAAEASYENGILKVRIPKLSQEKMKEIQVKLQRSL